MMPFPGEITISETKISLGYAKIIILIKQESYKMTTSNIYHVIERIQGWSFAFPPHILNH